MLKQSFSKDAVTTMEGAGAEVHRLFPVPGFMNYDPFVLWDHFEVAGDAGFPDHPHRGFEAITYMLEGGMEHADNLGNRSTVLSGGAQRFTAGRGIVHSEMPVPGQISRGIQLWINLPRRLKHVSPDYQQANADQLPVSLIPGGQVRTIVGVGSPIQLLTRTRYQDVTLAGDYGFDVAIPDGYRGLVYVLNGSLSIEEEQVDKGQAFFLEHSGDVHIIALTHARFMLALGHPHEEPIRQHGPYVD